MARNLPTIPTLTTTNAPALPVIQPLGATTTGQAIFPTIVGTKRPTIVTVQVPTTVARPTIPVLTQIAPLRPTTQAPIALVLPARRLSPTPVYASDEDIEEEDLTDIENGNSSDYSSEDENGSPFESPITAPFQTQIIGTPFPGATPLPLVTVPTVTREPFPAGIR